MLCSLAFSNDEILKIIRLLSVPKAHDHDNKSIKMIKIWDRFLVKPLISLFQNSIKSSHYPDLWKKFNIPVDKENTKQLIPNYCPISLVAICRKIFEKIISIGFMTFFK